MDAISLPLIDVNSFKLVSNSYAADKNGVYYKGFLLDSISPTDFQLLGGVINKLDRTDDGYIKDNRHVYFLKKKIDADANSLEVIKPLNNIHNVYENGYAKDKDHVFFFGKIMKQYSTNSFRILGWGYTLDQSGIYYDHKLISDSNYLDYIHKYDYLTTNKKVYFKGREMNFYDANTFQILLFHMPLPEIPSPVYDLYCYLTKDKNGIYLYNDKIDNVHLKTFEQIDRFVFQDKHNIYTITPPNYMTGSGIIIEKRKGRK